MENIISKRSCIVGEFTVTEIARPFSTSYVCKADVNPLFLERKIQIKPVHVAATKQAALNWVDSEITRIKADFNAAANKARKP